MRKITSKIFVCGNGSSTSYEELRSYALSNNNLDENNHPKPGCTKDLHKNLSTTYSGNPDSESATKFLLFLGLENDPYVKELVGNNETKAFTKAEALEYLNRLEKIGQTEHETGNSKLSPEQKLEYILNKYGLEKELLPQTEYCLKLLFKNSNFIIIQKDKEFTFGCLKSAEARNKPPFMELKSVLMKVDNSDLHEYIAFHLRGDETINIEKVAEYINLPKDKTLVECNANELGLFIGQVNPFALDYKVSQGKNLKITHIFSATLEKPIFDFENEINTNLGVNTKGFAAYYKDIKQALSNNISSQSNYLWNADFVKESAKELLNKREDYREKRICIYANNNTYFHTYFVNILIDEINQLSNNRFGIIPSISSVQDRLNNFSDITATNHLFDVLHSSATDNMDYIIDNEFLILGHTTGLKKESLHKQIEQKAMARPTKILDIASNVVEIIKAKEIYTDNVENKNFIVLTTKFIKNYYDKCAYSEICEKDNFIASDIIDEAASNIINNKAIKPKLAGKLYNEIIKLCEGNSAKNIIIGFLEIEEIIKEGQVSGGKTLLKKLQEDGYNIILPAEIVTKKLAADLHPALAEAKDKKVEIAQQLYI